VEPDPPEESGAFAFAFAFYYSIPDPGTCLRFLTSHALCDIICAIG
jgi:hypothetical protein